MRSYETHADADVSVSADAPEFTPKLVAVTEGRKKRWGLGDSPHIIFVQIVVFLGAVLVPLLYAPLTSSVLEYNKQAFLTICVAAGIMAWLLGVVMNGRMTIRISPIDKGVLGILLATIVATLFSVVKAKSIFGFSTSLSSSLVSVIAFSIFYFLTVAVTQDRGRVIRMLLGVSILLALLVGIAQVSGLYVLPGAFAHTRGFNSVGSFNALGVLAAIALPLFARSHMPGRSWMGKAFSVIGVGVSLVLLAMLNWWVLWAIALAGMLGMIAFDSLNPSRLAEAYGRKRRFALSRFVVPMIVVVLGAFLLLVRFNFSPVKNNLPVEVAPSYSLSLDIAGHVLKQKPITGWGPESFSIAFDRFGANWAANTQYANFTFRDSASEVITMVVHGGALMLLALVLMGWCIIQAVMRFSRALAGSGAHGEGAQWATESSGTIAALIATTVALFLYPFNVALFFVWYVLLALSALIIAGDNERTVDIEERPMYSLAASLGFIVALISVLSGLYFLTLHYTADVQYAFGASARKPADAMAKIIRAINLDPSNDQYLRDASGVSIRLLSDEIASSSADASGRTQRIQNLLSSSVQLAQRATVLNPGESMNWSNLGLVYASLTGLVDNVEQLAQDAFTKASDLRPGDPTFANQVGAAWLARATVIQSASASSKSAQWQAQYTDALSRAEKAFQESIADAPMFGLAIYNLGVVYDREGKTADAIKQLEKLAPYNADDATLMFELGLLYIRANQHEKGLAAMQRAVLVSPNYANAKWYLALLLEEKGDISGALQQLREIETNNQSNAVLEQKIAQLEAGTRAIPPAKVIDTKPLQ